MVDLNSTSAGCAEGLRGFEDLTLRFCSLRYLQPRLDVADDRKRRASGSGSVAGVGVGNSNTVGSGASAPGRITTPTGAAAGVGPAEQHGRSRRPSPARRNTVGSFALRPSPASVSTLSGGNQRRNGPTGGLGSSQGSIEDTEETENNTNNTQDDRKKQPVKRACNECRQQKLRCDVIQEPFAACSRCGRLKLECKIESNFKRIGKRSRNAEMEREIIELRRQIANANAAANAQQQHQQHQHSSSINQGPSSISTPFSSSQRNIYQTSTGLSGSQYMGSHEAVASLLDLRSGLDSSSFLRSSSSQVAMAKRLEGVSLAPERVTDLFSQFFTFYHPFLPFLDRDRSPEEYHSTSPLLFWSIISVGSRRYQADPTLLNALSGPVSRLVWSVLADVPQSYHVVKALALLCTWPFPTSSTSTDPTFMLCGMMMHIAMQIGLHRPSHAQDFSKFRIEFREGELKDRVKTWGICNIVAQRVATGYGQPSQTLFDWTLSSPESADQNFKLPAEIKCRLDIEKFCDKVTRGLYSNARDPVGLSCDDERFVVTSILTKDFEELEGQLRQEHNSITNLYLQAGGLHLRLAAFFDNPTAKDYRKGLLALYLATTLFLDEVLNLEKNVGPVLAYIPNYIYQMTLAAGFILLKLCKSFFAAHIDMDYTKALFNRTIWAIRSMSVSSNDLPERLAEVLAQMWRTGGAPVSPHVSRSSVSPEMDDTLQLKVRCRMSMSLVYDSVWRWREDFQAKGKNLESFLKNPTNPDSNADSSASSVAPLRGTSSTPGVPGADSNLPSAPSSHTINIGGEGNLNTSSSGNGMGFLGGFMEPNYEVFDPLNWMLDGLVDFPYSLNPVQGLES
ncbi:C6 zinc finger domain-containing protein [Histoplasma capsulatum G186AR]|uniref:C6 zinc finger domain-containing protein n=1 Tax=Ajellomyces capsulatus (strain G186AR / H82 / ATCC MYA-2454 / RMSCC 2432) TaxID=447093 RepID=C0NBE7_AJECG|nr:C6 zinc finger domain-containing protein [Histoplasma capsulatum G186AR]EEH10988.1 C6 zinc finger domain-containing protein [Histoplasma capsulatum G186AR]